MNPDRFQQDESRIPMQRLVHRLNDPLSAADLMANALALECEDEHHRHTASRISHEVRRVSQLLKLAAFCVDGKPGRWKPVRLDSIIAQAVASATSAAEDLPRPEVTGSTNCRRICGDAPLLMELFEQLILNAMEAASSRVEIEISPGDQCVWVRIADDGDGLSGTELDQVRQAFRTTKAGHFGLGLNVATKIASLHGAEFTIAHGQDRGLCAQVRFPEEQEDSR